MIPRLQSATVIAERAVLCDYVLSAKMIQRTMNGLRFETRQRHNRRQLRFKRVFRTDKTVGTSVPYPPYTGTTFRGTVSISIAQDANKSSEYCSTRTRVLHLSSMYVKYVV